MTNKEEYKSKCRSWAEAWLHGKHGVRKHRTGTMRSNSDWGSIPQASTAMGLLIFAHDYIDGISNQNYVNLGRQIMDYVLGNNNKGFSFLCGFGNNFPRSPHHRNVYQGANTNSPAPLVGDGLWVAGEKASGEYNDSYGDWVSAA